MAPQKKMSTNVRKVVKSILDARVEHKLFATTTNIIDWTTAGVVSLVSTDVFQGDDIGQRSGDLIRPRKFTFRIAVANNILAGSMLNRVILFQDTMANGSTPAVTDVLNTASYLSPLKPVTHQEKRFKIVRDFTISSVNATDTEKLEVTKVIQMRGIIHYIGGAGTAASAGKNTLYALFISDTQGTAGQKTYTWSYELEYTDA